jgi:uncharacterized sodium:solute symporter family permease YidK
MDIVFDSFVDALNATGTTPLTALEPLPVDAVMCLVVALAAFVWYENLGMYCRVLKARWLEREAKGV